MGLLAQNKKPYLAVSCPNCGGGEPKNPFNFPNNNFIEFAPGHDRHLAQRDDGRSRSGDQVKASLTLKIILLFKATIWSNFSGPKKRCSKSFGPKNSVRNLFDRK
jgi:hypothetical protein